MMETVEKIRESLISKILSIDNSLFLEALDNLIISSGNFNNFSSINLTNEQIKLLEMSEDDIKNGRLISQDNLFDRNSNFIR